MRSRRWRGCSRLAATQGRETNCDPALTPPATISINTMERIVDHGDQDVKMRMLTE
jgi:hypothetical protein